jgi:hypothetical protein
VDDALGYLSPVFRASRYRNARPRSCGSRRERRPQAKAAGNFEVNPLMKITIHIVLHVAMAATLVLVGLGNGVAQQPAVVAGRNVAPQGIILSRSQSSPNGPRIY